MATDKTEQKAIAQRLMAARKELGYANREEFAEAYGAPKKTIEKYEQGHSKVPPQLMLWLRDRHNLNLTWLMSGEGAMLDTVLTKALREAGSAPDANLGDAPSFDRAIEWFVKSAASGPARPVQEVSEELMETLARVVTASYESVGHRVSSEKVTVEATRLLNRLRNMVELADPREIELALELLKYQLRKRLQQASEAPGTGKRSAS